MSDLKEKILEEMDEKALEEILEAKKKKAMKEMGMKDDEMDDEEMGMDDEMDDEEEMDEMKMKKKKKAMKEMAEDPDAKMKNKKLKGNLDIKEMEEEPKADKKDAEADMKNKKLKANLDIKESLDKANKEIDSLLTEQDLSDEHKEKVQTVFEATIIERTRLIQEELEKIYEEKLDEAISELEADMIDNIDKYLDVVVNEWFEENEIAIERGIKAELTESFLSSMKAVFEDHYVDIPDEKVDLVENVILENEELEEKLNREVDEKISLKEELIAYKKKEIIEECSKNMTLSEKERLVKLCEDLEFENGEEFGKKVALLKENFLNKTTNDSEMIFEEYQKDDDSNAKYDDRYTSVLSKMGSNIYTN